MRRGNLEEAFLDRLEAGLNLRVAEFVLISLGAAFGLPLLVLVATRNLVPAVAAVPVGTVGPLLFLSLRAARRRARFEEQLPGTLQLLAGALQRSIDFDWTVMAINLQLSRGIPLGLLGLAGLGAPGYPAPNIVLANAVQRRKAGIRQGLARLDRSAHRLRRG